MRRIGVLLAVCAVAAGALLVHRIGWTDTATVARRQVAERVEQADIVWHLEDLYLAAANLQRLGDTIQGPQRRPDEHRNNDRVRVLVIGDSFTYGWGLADLDARWWVRLEDELNRRTRDGAFEVTAMSRGGASTLTQLGWVETLAAGGTVSEAYGVERPLDLSVFDVVVLGYVENDQIVNIGDGYVAPDDYVPVPPEEEYLVLRGELANPHWDAFVRGVADLRAVFADIPVIWLPLEHAGNLRDGRNTRVRTVFADAGYLIGETRAIDELAARVEATRLMVSPVDTHPGPALTERYAVDGADVVLAALDPARVERAVGGAAPVDRSLVSNHLPVHLEVMERSDAEATVVHDPATAVDDSCSGFASGPQRRIECRDGRTVHVVDGVSYDAQAAPCAVLGRPHAHVMLRRDLAAGTEAMVTVEQSEAASLALYVYGYDSDGFEVISSVGAFTSGETLVVELDRAARGLLVADASSAGCPGGSGTALPTFRLTITLR